MEDNVEIDEDLLDAPESRPEANNQNSDGSHEKK